MKLPADFTPEICADLVRIVSDFVVCFAVAPQRRERKPLSAIGTLGMSLADDTMLEIMMDKASRQATRRENQLR